MSGLVVFGVIAVIIVLIAGWVIGIYNKLVRLRNLFQNAFAQIEVQLKRRYDLIPNLVNTAKGYMKHESETLIAVTEARNAAVKALNAMSASPGDENASKMLAQAESKLAGAMSQFSLQVEAYPDLKASANMQQVSEELISTENKVGFARQAFNDAVTEYNSYRQSFPPVFFASMFGHGKDATLLEFEDSKAIQAAPKVEF